MYVKSNGEDKEPRFVVRFTPRKEAPKAEILLQYPENALAVIDEPMGHPAHSCIALVYRRNAVKRIIEVVDNRTVRILNPDEPVVFIVDIGGERGISNLGAYRSSPLIVGEIVRRAAAGYAV